MRYHGQNYIVPFVQYEDICSPHAEGCCSEKPIDERADKRTADIRKKIHFEVGSMLQDILQVLSGAELRLMRDPAGIPNADAVIWYLDIICRCGQEMQRQELRNCCVTWIVSCCDTVTEERLTSHQEYLEIRNPSAADLCSPPEEYFRELLYRQILTIISRQQCC